jgi:hypothetical protein
MISLSSCRIGNFILYAGEFSKITSLTTDKLGFFHRLHKDKEIFREYNSMSMGPIELTTGLIKQLGFVPYGDGQKMEHVSGNMYEFTDGRVILRTHSEGVSVFTPINMPWATPDFPLNSYWICNIWALHELQNLYYDLFTEELDIENISVV